VREFDVWMQSVPGPMSQYSGKVTVWAEDETDAVQRALQKLKSTSFPDRDASCWRTNKVEATGRRTQQ